MADDDYNAAKPSVTANVSSKSVREFVPIHNMSTAAFSGLPSYFGYKFLLDRFKSATFFN